MAFISASSAFLGTNIKTNVAKCNQTAFRQSANSPHWRMTATSPVSATSTSDDSDEPSTLVPVLLPVERIKLEKGSTFNMVRFAKDDFEPAPYFEGLTGKGVKVAVLDTGCDATHPALEDRIEYSLCKNYTSGSPDVWVDRDGHGTHCAGIICAEKNNAPMFGVAPEATLVVKKVLTENPDPGPRLSSAPIADAIRDAADEGCRVLSLSLGFNHPSIFRGIATPWRLGREARFAEFLDELYDACLYAMSKKAVIVVAAGNAGGGRKYNNPLLNSFEWDGAVNTIGPPASYGGVICVASHDDEGKISRFSSRGGELDFMAPGEVISTWPLGMAKGGWEEDLTRDMDGYSALRGTSMACPLVAGLAALLIEAGDRAKAGNLEGLSPALKKDIEDTGFEARNLYEVREMLRILAEYPNAHNRERGYGRLSRAYKLVKETVPESI